MLFYLILLTLTFVCPVVAVLVSAALGIKYWQFMRATGLNAHKVDFIGKHRLWSFIAQIACLLCSGLIMAVVPFTKLTKFLALMVFVIVIIGTLSKTLIAIYREHHQVDIHAFESDDDLDADVVRIFIEKRSILFNAFAITLMFVNIGLILNLL